jgi:hypothetical protein
LLLLLLLIHLGLADEHSLLLLEPLLLDVLILPLPREVQHRDGIRYQVLLDVEVKGRICRETGRLIHLQKPGFRFGIDEDVETEDLEAHGVLQVVGFRAALEVRDVRLRERLVAVECVHRQMLGSLGWHLLARHAWRPVHATLGRRRMAAALAARSGPVPFDAEVFMVFARHGAALRGAPSAEDTALLSADTMVTPIGRLAQRHRFQAPLPVLSAFVRMATKPGDWVIDPFAGGGSTLKVASDLGRRAWGCDVDGAAVAQAGVNLGLRLADGSGSPHEPPSGDDD